MTRLLIALAVISTVLFATPAYAVIQRCLPDPLPAPTAPVFTRDVQKFSVSEQMHLEVWRVPCDGSYALLMKVTPLSFGPFLCETDFSIVQDGAPFLFALADASVPGFCSPLFAPRTFSLVPKPPAFDVAAALTILFDSLSGVSRFLALEVAVAVPPPTVTVRALGCTTCSPGDTLGFDVRITNPGGTDRRRAEDGRAPARRLDRDDPRALRAADARGRRDRDHPTLFRLRAAAGVPRRRLHDRGRPPRARPGGAVQPAQRDPDAAAVTGRDDQQ